jgi:hypothetical protein
MCNTGLGTQLSGGSPVKQAWCPGFIPQHGKKQTKKQNKENVN